MHLPDGFLTQFAPYDIEAFRKLPQALEESPAVAVRMNPAKATQADVDRAISNGAEPVEWCDMGFYLPSRPDFTLDPRLHQGVYYVQDASSMFVQHALKHLLTLCSTPVCYLDACAAPGGKTTAALAVLPCGSAVVANEFVAQRCGVLRENLTKWGYANVAVCQGSTSRFAAHPDCFDIVAADVPCSGEGMMRKDPTAIEQWSPALVEQCARLQREILDNLWTALRPRGYLIYSTCTFNRRENEEQLHYLRDRYGAVSIAIPAAESWGVVPAIDSDMAAWRFIPGAVRGEGQFVGVVQKPASEEAPRPTRKHSDRRQKPSATKNRRVPDEIVQWVEQPEAFDWRLTPEGEVKAILRYDHRADFAFRPEMTVASLKGRDAIPSHALAMAVGMLRKDAFAAADLCMDDALQYLRANAITLPDSAPRGLVLLQFEGRPLGFAKNLGNRANNLYPRQWRILRQ